VYERPRWETIERSLRDVQWDNIHQLVDAMLEYYYPSSHAAASQSPSSSSSSSSSNLTTASDIQFYSLSTYFDSIMEANRRRFMEETLESIVDLALQLPQLCPQSLPLLRKQVQLTLWLYTSRDHNNNCGRNSIPFDLIYNRHNPHISK